jgi:hypothetical protein
MTIRFVGRPVSAAQLSAMSEKTARLSGGAALPTPSVQGTPGAPSVEERNPDFDPDSVLIPGFLRKATTSGVALRPAETPPKSWTARSFFQSFKPSVNADAAKTRAARMNLAQSPQLAQPLAGGNAPIANVAAQLGSAPKALLDFAHGFFDTVVAPISGKNWRRAPGAQQPANLPSADVLDTPDQRSPAPVYYLDQQTLADLLQTMGSRAPDAAQVAGVNRDRPKPPANLGSGAELSGALNSPVGRAVETALPGVGPAIAKVLTAIAPILDNSLSSFACDAAHPGDADSSGKQVGPGWPGCAIPGGSVEALIAGGMSPAQAQAIVAAVKRGEPVGGGGASGIRSDPVHNRLSLQ